MCGRVELPHSRALRAKRLTIQATWGRREDRSGPLFGIPFGGAFAGLRLVVGVDGLRKGHDGGVGVEEWIVGLGHPFGEAAAQILQGFRVDGILGDVISFLGIKYEVVEFFFWYRTIGHAVGHPEALAVSVVAIGHDGGAGRTEVPNVVPALRAHAAFRFKAAMEGDFGIVCFANALNFTPDQWEEGITFQMFRAIGSDQFTDRGIDIEMADQGIGHGAGTECFGQAENAEHAGAVLSEAAFHAGKGDTVVGGGEDKGVVGQA